MILLKKNKKNKLYHLRKNTDLSEYHRDDQH